MGDHPCTTYEDYGDDQESIAVARESLPCGWTKIIECGQGYAGEETVEAGPGGIIDKRVIVGAEGGLLGCREEIVPDEAANSETGEEEYRQQPDGVSACFEDDEEKGQDQIELFFDA